MAEKVVRRDEKIKDFNHFSIYYRKGFWCKLLKGSALRDNGRDDGDPARCRIFSRGHFDQEIIVLCIRWYLAFQRRSRDLVQMMAERCISSYDHPAMGAAVRAGL